LNIQDVKEDVDWKIHMPAAYRRLVCFLTHYLRLRYGYARWRMR
jgi:hypothetical protein